MPEYSGSTECGVRASNLGATSEPIHTDMLHKLADSVGAGGTGFHEDARQLDDSDGGLDDDAQDELRQMGQFIEDMAVVPEVDNLE